VDFVVLDTGHDLKAPIILGCPFLHIAKATIHAGSAKISFQIKDRVEKISFKISSCTPLNFCRNNLQSRKLKARRRRINYKERKNSSFNKEGLSLLT